MDTLTNYQFGLAAFAWILTLGLLAALLGAVSRWWKRRDAIEHDWFTRYTR